MVLGRSRLDETGAVLFLPELGLAKSRQDRSNLRIRLVLASISVRMALAARHRDISGQRTVETARHGSTITKQTDENRRLH